MRGVLVEKRSQAQPGPAAQPRPAPAARPSPGQHNIMVQEHVALSTMNQVLHWMYVVDAAFIGLSVSSRSVSLC